MLDRRGFTLVEALVVIAIVILLAGLVAILASSGKRAARTARAISNMRQIHLAAELYMADNDASSANAVSGLPKATEYTRVPWSEVFDTPQDLWIGCGEHPYAVSEQSVTYFFVWDRAPYDDWAQKWHDAMPLVFDLQCSPSHVHIENLFETRYGLAVTVGGTAVRKWNTGNPLEPVFWSEPPNGR